MKNILLIVSILFINITIFAQDKIIYIKKENFNEVQLKDLQSRGAILDNFTVHTDKTLLQKIEQLNKKWDRDTMEELWDEFSFSPKQFGQMIDILSGVIIKQSNDIPNTKVGKIALVGFAWKMAGPDIFRFFTRICFIVFFISFFLWSYKRNLWTNTFVLEKEGKIFGKVIKKEKFDEDDLFNGDDPFEGTSDTRITSKWIHILGFLILIIFTLFVL